MIKILIIILVVFLLLFIYSACVVSSRCSREEEFMQEKVYVVIDEGIWNDSSSVNVIGASNNPKVAEDLFAEHIKKVKEEIDFYNLDAVEENDEDLDNEDEYIYEETENYFSIYLNGNYDNNHILIKVEEVSLTNELEGELVK